MSGFRPGEAALVYLLRHERLQAAKVGVCNMGTGRISRHLRRGWQLHATLAFEAGRDALRLEREVLAEWRAQDLEPVRDGGRSYDGWTETASLSSAMTVEVLWSGVLQLGNLVAEAADRGGASPAPDTRPDDLA